MTGDKKTPKRVTVEVEPELHRQAKIKAASEGRTIADVVRELLAGWTGGRPGAPAGKRSK